MLESLTRSGPLIRSPTTQEDAIKAAARGSSPSAGPPGKRPRDMNEFPRKFGHVRAAQAAGPRGHGRAVPGAVRARGHGQALRHQDGAAAPGGQGIPAAIPRRGQGGRAPVARQPGAGLRLWPGRRRDLPGHGLRRGARPARHLEPLRQEGDRVPGRRRRAHRARAGARPLLRAHVRRHQAGPPGRLAAQRAAVVQRRGAADRLRVGVVHLEDREDRARHHLRQGQLHVARAGARRDRSTGAPTFTRRGSSCGSC